MAIDKKPSARFHASGSLRYKTEKPANTTSVITSCMVLSCAGVYTALPQRLAGTASQYSKNAMPQLTTIVSGSQLSLNFKWPYHANVMKTLEANSIRTGNSDGEIVGMDILSKFSALTHRRGARFRPQSISFDPTIRKSPAGSVNHLLSIEPESTAAIATIGQAGALLLAGNENRHAVRLARNLRSGPDDSDGFDRHLCRRSFCRCSQPRAAVCLHRRVRRLAEWPCLGHDQRCHCARGFGAVFSQPSRGAWL